jgi:hypothetical protein
VIPARQDSTSPPRKRTQRARTTLKITGPRIYNARLSLDLRRRRQRRRYRLYKAYPDLDTVLVSRILGLSTSSGGAKTNALGPSPWAVHFSSPPSMSRYNSCRPKTMLRLDLLYTPFPFCLLSPVSRLPASASSLFVHTHHHLARYPTEVFADSQRLALARAASSFSVIITYYSFLDAPSCVFLCLVLWRSLASTRLM